MAEPSRASTATIVGVAVVIAIIVVVFLVFFWPNMQTDHRIDIEVIDPTEQLTSQPEEADTDAVPPPDADTSTAPGVVLP